MLDQFGRPIRSGKLAFAPDWLERVMAPLVSNYDADRRIRELRESVRDPFEPVNGHQIGRVVTVRLPQRYRSGGH